MFDWQQLIVELRIDKLGVLLRTITSIGQATQWWWS